MKITDVEAILIAIPLRRPTSMSNRTVTSREYVVTRVHADEGITGSAYDLPVSSHYVHDDRAREWNWTKRSWHATGYSNERGVLVLRG
jgi:hypothetical protein